MKRFILLVSRDAWEMGNKELAEEYNNLQRHIDYLETDAPEFATDPIMADHLRGCQADIIKELRRRSEHIRIPVLGKPVRMCLDTLLLWAFWSRVTSDSRLLFICEEYGLSHTCIELLATDDEIIEWCNSDASWLDPLPKELGRWSVAWSHEQEADSGWSPYLWPAPRDEYYIVDENGNRLQRIYCLPSRMKSQDIFIHMHTKHDSFLRLTGDGPHIDIKRD